MAHLESLSPLAPVEPFAPGLHAQPVALPILPVALVEAAAETHQRRQFENRCAALAPKTIVIPNRKGGGFSVIIVIRYVRGGENPVDAHIMIKDDS